MSACFAKNWGMPNGSTWRPNADGVCLEIYEEDPNDHEHRGANWTPGAKKIHGTVVVTRAAEANPEMPPDISG